MEEINFISDCSLQFGTFLFVSCFYFIKDAYGNLCVQLFLSISVIFLGINDPVGTITVNYFGTDLIISKIYLTALFALLVSFFSAKSNNLLSPFEKFFSPKILIFILS